MKRPKVAVIMGSKSDLPTMDEAVKILEDFGIPHEVRILSAHRTPDETVSYAKAAVGRGLKVIIAGAGGAAHLAGVMASHTTLPVIGVPMETKSLKGLDSLLSTVQMPGGVPVGTVAIGKSGAKNAALLSLRILGLNSERIEKKLRGYKRRLAKGANLKWTCQRLLK